MSIISIQSQVAYGCAGNTIAVPILQRLGATVWPVPTTLLSNTPIYPTVEGGPVKPQRLAALLNGVLERSGAEGIDAVLTGYMASAENARVTAAFIENVKAANPKVIYQCDPVMGDATKGLYVPDEVAQAICEDLVPRADILVPNLFEASFLTHSEVPEPDALARRLSGVTQGIGIVKNIPSAHTITNLASGDQADWTAECPKLDAHFTGTGDAFSAAFLGFFLQDLDGGRALHAATDLVFRLIEEADTLGLTEIDFARLRKWEAVT